MKEEKNKENRAKSKEQKWESLRDLYKGR